MVSWQSWNKTNALAGLNPDDYSHDDVSSFRHGDPMWRDLVTLLKPNILIEVGTYRGRTAIYLANIVRDLGLPAKVICVDTWVGSPEHWGEPNASASYWTLERKFGFPTLYWTFAANVIASGVDDIIIPLPSTSESAIVVLKHARVKADVIFVDAAHEYEPALRDYRYYWDLLADDGVLVGDDYLGWDGVTRAANAFSEEKGVLLDGKMGKFIMSKGKRKFKFIEGGRLVETS